MTRRTGIETRRGWWGLALFTVGCGGARLDGDGFGAGEAGSGAPDGVQGSTTSGGGDEIGSDGDADGPAPESGSATEVESSSGAEPVASACEQIAAQWVDQGDGTFAVDFDGAGERPPAILSCSDVAMGHARLGLAGPAFNVDLAAIVGPVELDALELALTADAVVGSYSVDEPALTSGAWPAGIELVIVNGGVIQGAGGVGGYGGVCGTPSTAGGPGGPALELHVDAAVINEVESDGAMLLGRVLGGGGGGGGGGDGCDEGFCGGTGGGGGGAGSQPGAGGDAADPADLPSLGAGGTCDGWGGTNFPGNPGTATSGGTGGGQGGAPGSAGGPGQTVIGWTTTDGQPGGPPGCAVVLVAAASVTIAGGDVVPALDDAGCHASRG